MSGNLSKLAETRGNSGAALTQLRRLWRWAILLTPYPFVCSCAISAHRVYWRREAYAHGQPASPMRSSATQLRKKCGANPIKTGYAGRSERVPAFQAGRRGFESRLPLQPDFMRLSASHFCVVHLPAPVAGPRAPRLLRRCRAERGASLFEYDCAREARQNARVPSCPFAGPASLQTYPSRKSTSP